MNLENSVMARREAKVETRYPVMGGRAFESPSLEGPRDVKYWEIPVVTGSRGDYLHSD